MDDWKPTPPCSSCAHLSSLIDSTEYQLEIAHKALQEIRKIAISLPSKITLGEGQYTAVEDILKAIRKVEIEYADI